MQFKVCEKENNSNIHFTAYEHAHCIYMEMSPKTVSNPVALLDPIMQLLCSDVSRDEHST